ncbi:MAG TPA: hypothetical protein VK066_14685 [Chloroflexota bacterium]|nr:hypothetical protein [Chloroflexota bacterium]
MRCGKCGEELIPTRAEDIYQCPRCSTVWQLAPETGQWVSVGQAGGTDRPLDELFDDD